MNKKKVIIVTLIVTVFLAITGSLWYYLTKEYNKTSLTLIEKQWIEKNKNRIYDFGLPINIPMFTSNGSGIIFDFLKDLETNTGLVINRVSYEKGSTIPEYAMRIKNSLDKNDILIYKDTYAIVTKNSVKYNSLSEIKDLNIKVLKGEDEALAFYLSDNENLKITVFDSSTDLLSNVTTDKDAIIVPKTEYLKQIIENNNLNIAYNLNDLPIYYTITLGSNDKLNTILTKFYNKWKTGGYDKSYNNNFASTYFQASAVSALEEQQFRSKIYKYGYIINTPFDTIINNKLEGINTDIIDSFSHLSGITIESTMYGSYEELVKAFENNEIDFFMNGSNRKLNEDVYDTISVYDEKIVIVSHNDNDSIIDSVNSLKGKKVNAIKDSKIMTYLEERGVEVIESSNSSSMMNKLDKNSIIALDKTSYNFYRQKDLKDYKIDYEFPLKKEYDFTFKKNDENKVFMNFFNFYLSYINEKVTINNTLYKLTNIKENSNLLGELIGVSVISGLLILSLLTLKNISKRTKNKFKKHLTKEEKLKYIDMLTSLKNRNYLNDNINVWDESEIYPQAVIVVDLNDISYINDNYGHAEGDEVIREAANILIKNQLPNTEIIRTNGNEFLVYLVGYDERQVVAHLKKLNKELRDLKHGYGSASGHSMILDGIKTIDDAINEATIEMRNNKEEATK